jgi:hypothetical protein
MPTDDPIGEAVRQYSRECAERAARVGSKPVGRGPGERLYATENELPLKDMVAELRAIQREEAAYHLATFGRPKPLAARG